MMRLLLAMPVVVLVSVGCLDTDVSHACALEPYADFCTLTATSLSPEQGSISGGTEVTVFGTGFDRDTTLEVDGTVTAVTSRTSNRLTFRTQPHVPGPVTVSVRNALGEVTVGTQFRFVEGPALTRISPPEGNRTGGYTATVSGSNLTGGVVKISGVEVEKVSGTDTEIVVNIPPLQPGRHDVEVVANQASAILPQGFWARAWRESSEGWAEASGASLSAPPNGSEAGPIYLAAMGGVLYRASSLLMPWTRVFTHPGIQLHWVAVSPVDSLRVLSASERGIVLTTDGFVTASPRSPDRITGGIVFSADGSRAIAGASNGIMISRDQGATFTRYEAVNGPVLRVAAALDDPNVLAAATGNELYTSVDAGETWNQRGLPGGGVLGLSVNAQRVAVTDSVGLSLYPLAPPNAGFNVCFTVPVGAPAFTHLASDPELPSRVWMAGGSVHSTETTTSTCSPLTGTGPDPFGYAWALGIVARTKLLAASQFTVHFRDTGVVGWAELRAGLDSPKVTSISRPPSATNRVLFGVTHAGQVYSRTGASAWSAFGPSPGQSQNYPRVFAFPNGSGFRVLHLADLVQTLPHSGGTWTPSAGISGLTRDAKEDTQSSAPLHPVLVATANGVYVTTDGGVSFSSVMRNLDPATRFTMVEFANDTFYGLTADGRVFSTPASGSAWAELPRFTAETLLRAFVRTTGSLLISGGNAGFYRLADGAPSWVKVPAATLTADRTVADPRNRSVLYTKYGPSFARSTDEGNSWQTLNDGTYSEQLVETAAVDPVDGRVYLIGTSFIESLPGAL